MWTVKDQSHKTSRGGLSEQGLIWLTPDKEIAEMYAKGSEAIKDFESGKVFVVKTPKPYRLTERYANLSEEEAEKLSEINFRTYDKITSKNTIAEAVSKLWKWDRKPQGFKEVLEYLGYDGILYDQLQYGILADQLPIVDSYSVIKPKRTKVEPIKEKPISVTETSEPVPDDIKEILKLLRL